MKLTDIKQALAAYQTGHYPKQGDASRTLETLTKALPHLIAIAEAAERVLKTAKWGDDPRINYHQQSPLYMALNELEKA